MQQQNCGSIASSQCGKILAHLQSGRSITAGEALRLFGCFRLAARINDLRAMGHNIHSEIIGVTNAEGRKSHIARYSLLPGKAGRRADA